MMWIVNIFVKQWDTELDEISLIAYKKSVKECNLIHYCDTFKPWKNIDFEFADYWWETARHTPFYEELLMKNIRPNCENGNTKIAATVKEIKKYEKKMRVHRFLKHITFGKMHKKHKKSVKDYRERLKNL